MALSDQTLQDILRYLTEETGLAPFQVANTVELLRDGATVPFIARYRKERTGELDEVGIRGIEERLAYFTELEERKLTVLKSIEEQGKLTPELADRIRTSRQKTEIEDLYLPYKPKRRTKATIARERGLEPLADLMAAQELTAGTPEEAALPFVDPAGEVPGAAAALEGAGHILAERLADDADARAFVRRLTADQGIFCSRVAADRKGAVTKFEMYYDHREPLKSVPSHRMLAMRRGEKEEVLILAIEAPTEEILAGLRARMGGAPASSANFWKGWRRTPTNASSPLPSKLSCGWKPSSGPMRRPSPSSPRTFGTSSWHRRPAASGSSAWTRGCGPAPSWLRWTAPAGSWSM